MASIINKRPGSSGLIPTHHYSNANAAPPIEDDGDGGNNANLNNYKGIYANDDNT
jgi:hypothetical protein